MTGKILFWCSTKETWGALQAARLDSSDWMENKWKKCEDRKQFGDKEVAVDTINRIY